MIGFPVKIVKATENDNEMTIFVRSINYRDDYTLIGCGTALCVRSTHVLTELNLTSFPTSLATHLFCFLIYIQVTARSCQHSLGFYFFDFPSCTLFENTKSVHLNFSSFFVQATLSFDGFWQPHKEFPPDFLPRSPFLSAIIKV